MKNSITSLSLLLATGFPVAFIMELAGTRLPAIVDSTHLFGAFMFISLLNLAFTDYARALQPLLANPDTLVELPSCSAAKNALRLAA
jgi:hypothetical protein